jgi:hypothetical protein
MSYVSITIGKRSRSPQSVDGAMTEQQVDTENYWQNELGSLGTEAG